MGERIKYRSDKQKQWTRKVSNGEYITSHTDLKNFAKQVEAKHIPDEHFAKAYDKFKTPAYHMKGE